MPRATRAYPVAFDEIMTTAGVITFLNGVAEDITHAQAEALHGISDIRVSYPDGEAPLAPVVTSAPVVTGEAVTSASEQVEGTELGNGYVSASPSAADVLKELVGESLDDVQEPSPQVVQDAATVETVSVPSEPAPAAAPAPAPSGAKRPPIPPKVK